MTLSILKYSYYCNTSNYYVALCFKDQDNTFYNINLLYLERCPNGTEWVSERETCLTCDMGTYRTQGVDYYCTQCPDGKNTTKVGAASVHDCADSKFRSYYLHFGNK